MSFALNSGKIKLNLLWVFGQKDASFFLSHSNIAGTIWTEPRKNRVLEEWEKAALFPIDEKAAFYLNYFEQLIYCILPKLFSIGMYVCVCMCEYFFLIWKSLMQKMNLTKYLGTSSVQATIALAISDFVKQTSLFIVCGCSTKDNIAITKSEACWLLISHCCYKG